MGPSYTDPSQIRTGKFGAGRTPKSWLDSAANENLVKIMILIHDSP